MLLFGVLGLVLPAQSHGKGFVWVGPAHHVRDVESFQMRCLDFHSPGDPGPPGLSSPDAGGWEWLPITGALHWTTKKCHLSLTRSS